MAQAHRPLRRLGPGSSRSRFWPGWRCSVDAIFKSSATYDEVAYLSVAARWWRTGDQAEITRMGSPLTFWKLQQVPVLWLLDHMGRRDWIDDPIGHQRELLPLVRLGSLWIWLVALGTDGRVEPQSHGPRAMALAAWLFALSPNLIAHGALATMELPLVAATTAMFWFFWRFLRLESMALVLGEPLRPAAWLFRASSRRSCFRRSWPLSGGSRAGKAESAAACRLTCAGRCRGCLRSCCSCCSPTSLSPGLRGFRSAPLRDSIRASRNGSVTRRHRMVAPAVRNSAPARLGRICDPDAPSGLRRTQLPLGRAADEGLVVLLPRGPGGQGAAWLLAPGRPPGWRSARGQRSRERRRQSHGNLLPLIFLLFLSITAVGSSRNYGVRYLLPLAPLAIVWVSALAESRAIVAASCRCRRAGRLRGRGGGNPSLRAHVLQHPGGRADRGAPHPRGLQSRLGPGAQVALSASSTSGPISATVTFYYFGDTDPAYYGVAGRCSRDQCRRRPVALTGPGHGGNTVSRRFGVASMGPVGPAGFFRDLDQLEPVRLTDDTTIAIYRTAEPAMRDGETTVGEQRACQSREVQCHEARL